MAQKVLASFVRLRLFYGCPELVLANRHRLHRKGTLRIMRNNVLFSPWERRGREALRQRHCGCTKTASFRFRVFCSPEPVLANGGNFLYTTWGRLHNEICVFLTWPLLIELQSAHQRRCLWPLQDRRLRIFPRLAIFVCVCPSLSRQILVIIHQNLVLIQIQWRLSNAHRSGRQQRPS